MNVACDGLGTITMMYPIDQQDEGRTVVEEIQSLISTGQYKPEDFTVLYRTNAQSADVEDFLIGAGLPYVIKNGFPFFLRKVVADLIAYCKAAFTDDLASYVRIGNIAPNGHSDTSHNLGSVFWTRVEDYHKRNRRVPMSDVLLYVAHAMYEPQRDGVVSLISIIHAIKKAQTVPEAIQIALSEVYNHHMEAEYGPPKEDGDFRQDNIEVLIGVASRFNTSAEFFAHVDRLNKLRKQANGKNGQNVEAVKLMTLHGSKGLEFKVVFLIGLLEGLLPHKRGDRWEEMRLFYVGVTRAMERLYLCAPIEALDRRGKPIELSHFLTDAELPAPPKALPEVMAA